MIRIFKHRTEASLSCLFTLIPLAQARGVPRCEVNGKGKLIPIVVGLCGLCSIAVAATPGSSTSAASADLKVAGFYVNWEARTFGAGNWISPQCSTRANRVITNTSNRFSCRHCLSISQFSLCDPLVGNAVRQCSLALAC